MSDWILYLLFGGLGFQLSVLLWTWSVYQPSGWRSWIRTFSAPTFVVAIYVASIIAALGWVVDS